MIVRLSGEGQFRLPDEDAERLNELDNRAVKLAESDVILPPRDLSLEEAKAEFTGEGLIPD